MKSVCGGLEPIDNIFKYLRGNFIHLHLLSKDLLLNTRKVSDCTLIKTFSIMQTAKNLDISSNLIVLLVYILTVVII